MEKISSCKFLQKILVSLIYLIGFSFTHASMADTDEKVLRVGIVEPVAPFIIPLNGAYSGISIDVWQFVATRENMKYKYVTLEGNADDALKKLQKGEVDVLIGPISVSSQRYSEADFSYPYFLNSVGIIENADNTDFLRLMQVFTDVLKSPLFIGFILSFFIYIHILWWLERGRIQNFHLRYFQGMSHILWTHLLQKGYKEIPHTLPGRIVSLGWVLAAAVFVTAILATVTSKLTLALVSKPEHFTHVTELRDQFVAAVKGTHAYTEAKKAGAHVIVAENIKEATAWLDQKRVAAVAEDYILAKEYLNKVTYPNLHFSSLTLSNDQYAIIVQKNSPLLAKVNDAILFLEDDDSIEPLCSRYIGADAKLCKL